MFKRTEFNSERMNFIDEDGFYKNDRQFVWAGKLKPVRHLLHLVEIPTQISNVDVVFQQPKKIEYGAAKCR